YGPAGCPDVGSPGGARRPRRSPSGRSRVAVAVYANMTTSRPGQLSPAPPVSRQLLECTAVEREGAPEPRRLRRGELEDGSRAGAHDAHQAVVRRALPRAGLV